MRANIQKYPLYSLLTLFGVVVIYFSLSVMIWERPYYTFTVSNGTPVVSKDFSTVLNSMWYTVVTMTTVGFGDVVARTPVGRFITIGIIFAGAYLTALTIAVQANLLSLKESGKEAMITTTEQKSAIDLIVAALRLQIARKRRYRLSGTIDAEPDYIPSKEDIERLRKQLSERVKCFKKVRCINSTIKKDETEL